MKIHLISLLFLLLCACSHNSSDKKKIGFLMRTYTLERCVLERDFFTEKAKALGADVVFADANNDDRLQIEQGFELLKQGVDVLVIFAVNGQSCAPIIREANRLNIPVIAYESLVENCKLDYFVTADNEKGGELMTSYIVKKVPEGNYVMLGGNKADKNAILIKKGQHTIIDPLVKAGRIKIKYDVFADWNATEGYFETNKYLNLANNVPDVILSSNDGLATGVIQALEEIGLAGKVEVTGLDGELSAFQRIAKGTQSMTIFKSFKKQAYAAAEMAVQIANGKTPDNITKNVNNNSVDVPSLLLEPVVVDRSNLEEIIIKGGVYSREKVFGTNL